MLLLLAGCASAPSYKVLDGMLARGEFDKAVAKVENQSKAYSSRSKLIYAMDRLMTAHLAGRYDESAEWAQKAHVLIEELYTISLSGEALTWLVNDGNQDYRGEHFEQIMVHLFGLLNYAAQGNPEEALVESRRAELKFKERERRFGSTGRYNEDALMRWTSALMYEAQGELHDALLDYRKSLDAYKSYPAAFGVNTPRQAVADVLRLADKLKENDILKQVKGDFPEVETPAWDKNSADVIVLVYDGQLPSKVSMHWDVPVSGKGYAQYFSVAYPAFQKGKSVLKGARVISAQGTETPLEIFGNLEAIAVADLEDRMLGIKTKAIARGLAKFQAAKAIQENQDSDGKKLLAALVTNVFTLATEQADTRSWHTLPGRIWAAKLKVEPGLQDIQLEIQLKDGKSITKAFDGVEAIKGKPLVLITPVY